MVIIMMVIMTKAVIIVIMEELVPIAIGTVIKMTYRWISMEKKAGLD